MDCFYEIAGVPVRDAIEALDRLTGRQDYPSHLRARDYDGLRENFPLLWRSELVNWFYHRPAFAAAVWKELHYCESNREKIARRAIGILFEHSRPGPLWRGLFENGLPGPQLRGRFSRARRLEMQENRRDLTLQVPLLRAAWIAAILDEFGHGIDLSRREEDLVRELAAAMKPRYRVSDGGPLERACELLADLIEAIGLHYEAPEFIEALLRTLAERRGRPFTRDQIFRFAEILIADRRHLHRTSRRLGVPLPFAMVQEQELDQIAAARQDTGRAGQYNAARTEYEQQTGVRPPPPGTPIVAPAAAPNRRALEQNLVGLAFSGGGIRSATFNLGVLQALAKLNLLRHFDYLSTVSGGGYIGSWFNAWTYREAQHLGAQNGGAAALDEMRQRLSPARTPDPLDARVRPVRYLREFSNYLTPETGFFSADTWTMVAIYLRNALLNLLVFIPLIAAVLLLPRPVFWLTTVIYGEHRNPLLAPILIAGLVLLAFIVLMLNLRRITPPQDENHSEPGRRGRGPGTQSVPRYARQGYIQALVVVPLLLASWLASSSFWLWLNGPHRLSNGVRIMHWRELMTWQAVDSVLPNRALASGAVGGLIVCVIFVAVFALARGFAVQWIKYRDGQFALVQAVAAAYAGSMALIWSLNGVLHIPAHRNGDWQDKLLHIFAPLLLLILIASVVGVIAAKGKELMNASPTWVSVGTIAAAAGVFVVCIFWAAAHLLEWLQPERVWPPIDNVWPRDSIRGAATATAVVVLVFLFVFRASRGFMHYWPKKWRRQRAWGSLLLATVGSAIAAFGLFWGIGTMLDSMDGDAGLWYTIAFGAPLTLSALSVIVAVQLGLLGSFFPDEQREWWSRLRAWTLIYSIAWTLLFTLALFPPVWSRELAAQVGKWGGAGAALVWVFSTIAGIRTAPRAAELEKQSHESASGGAGTQPAPGGDRLKAMLLKALATVAPYIFIVGLLCAVALATDAILSHVQGNGDADVWTRFTEYPNGLLGWIALALFLASAMMSWRIGVNEFSMHHFYKNRLVRCYLGASRWQERTADWFTGFDREDDMRMSRFDRESPATGGAPRYAGPYPIVNAALNLVAGEDLAWQERKATSFVFTPKYCGYDLDRAVLTKRPSGFWPDAYAPTCRYVYDGAGPKLGMAMAISGAAASPNMGRATSPASAFLMTLFNVRLGWWLPNPRRVDCWTSPSPPLGVSYTALELFGLTDDKTRFVNVSDGGHFENLGVYELIRRGCRFIVACDAGQDGSFLLEDLGNLVRKCRVDFGVDIDIGVDLIRNRDAKGWSQAHCVVGKIHYRRIPKCDTAGRVLFENGAPLHEEGVLVYLKPSISGDEPYDVLEYYKRVPEFPHESTGDQWFNESQFESYRQLGLHIAEMAFRRYAREDEPVYPPELFDRLKNYWHPPSPKISAYSTEHTLEYSRIMELIRSREDLSYLDSALFGGIRDHGLKVANRDEFYLCNSLIQLIENVYADLDLEENYDHPHVTGWMRVFRNWVREPAFQRTWKISRNTYAERFQNFYTDRLENGGPD